MVELHAATIPLDEPPAECSRRISGDLLTALESNQADAIDLVLALGLHPAQLVNAGQRMTAAAALIVAQLQSW